MNSEAYLAFEFASIQVINFRFHEKVKLSIFNSFNKVIFKQKIFDPRRHRAIF